MGFGMPHYFIGPTLTSTMPNTRAAQRARTQSQTRGGANFTSLSQEEKKNNQRRNVKHAKTRKQEDRQNTVLDDDSDGDHSNDNNNDTDYDNQDDDSQDEDSNDEEIEQDSDNEEGEQKKIAKGKATKNSMAKQKKTVKGKAKGKATNARRKGPIDDSASRPPATVRPLKRSSMGSQSVQNAGNIDEEQKRMEVKGKLTNGRRKGTTEDSAIRPTAVGQVLQRPLPPPPKKRGAVSTMVANSPSSYPHFPPPPLPLPKKRIVVSTEVANSSSSYPHSPPPPLPKKGIAASTVDANLPPTRPDSPPSQVKGCSSEDEQGWEILKDYLLGSTMLSTQPLVEAELEKIFGRDVAAESPWQMKIAQITAVKPDDDHARSKLLDEIDAELVRCTRPSSTSVPVTQDVRHSGGRDVASSSNDVSKNLHSGDASETSYSDDDDLSPKDREQLATARADLEQDISFFDRAEHHNAQMAQEIWSQLLDQLFECAENHLYPSNKSSGPRKYLDREETDIADLCAYVLSHDPHEYALFRNSARTDWLDIERMGLEIDEDMRSKFDSDFNEEGNGSEENPPGFDTTEWSDRDVNRSTYSSPRSAHSSPRSAHSSPRSAHSSPRSAHSSPRQCLVDYTSSQPHEDDENLTQPEQNPSHQSRRMGGSKAVIVSDEEEAEEVVSGGENVLDADKDEEVDEDDDREDVDEDATKKGGRLSRSAKADLDRAQAEYEAKVASIAAKANKNVHTCWRYLNETTHAVRNVSSFNAYQAWYRVHGEYEKPDEMEKQDWNRFVSQQYREILKSNLKDEECDDEELRRKLFAEQIEWYKEHHDAFMAKKRADGKFHGTVKSMLKPLHALGMQMYRNTGAHLLGHLVITDPDAESRSRSVSWGCTDVVKQVIEDNAIHLRTQLTDIETMLRSKEMELRGIDEELARLATACIKTKTESARDRDRRVISRCFAYDVERCTGSKMVSLSPGQFVKNAYKHHVRVINWPVGVTFFGAGLVDLDAMSAADIKKVEALHAMSAADIKKVEALHAMSAADIKKVTGPRIAQIMHEVNGGDDDNEIDKCFEIVSWDEDETKLSLEDQARVPIVSDTQGNTIITVSYSKAFQKEIQQEKELRGNKNDDNDEFYKDDDVPTSSRQQLDEAINTLKPQTSQFAARLLRQDQPNLGATPHPHPRTQVDTNNRLQPVHPRVRTEVDINHRRQPIVNQPDPCPTPCPTPRPRTQANINQRLQPIAEAANQPTLHSHARTEVNINRRRQPIMDTSIPHPQTQLNPTVNQPNPRPTLQPRPHAQVNLPSQQEAVKQRHTPDIRTSQPPSKTVRPHPRAHPHNEAEAVRHASTSQLPHTYPHAVSRPEQQYVANPATPPPQPPRPRPRPLHRAPQEQVTGPNLKRKRDHSVDDVRDKSQPKKRSNRQ
ncbi:hypothetical protein EV361DRAFT_952616 [Lentinula raphanica]|nr:hypothetical protein EV361DRAFT_952616 [Lentinula raphanica]